MNNVNLAVVSAYYPNKLNEGGGPTGLLWEILDYLSNVKKYNINIFHVDLPKNSIMKIIRRNGIYLSRFKEPLDKYDLILTYPDDMIFYLPKRYWEKTIVLGPDSPSFRDARYLRMKKNCIEKIIKYFMYSLSRYNEYVVLKNIKKYIVVGNTDARFMKRNSFLENKSYLKDKVVFLRHPLLTNVVNVNFVINNKECKKFIFSITPKKHNEDFMYGIFDALKNKSKTIKNTLHIQLIGERSKWMYEYFSSINCCKVEYIKWVDDYKDICVAGRDVHCMALTAGSGTKNRTLTAIANGLEIITTPIGIENIPWRDRCGIYITSSSKEFVDYMVRINDDDIVYNEENIRIDRKKIIQRINEDYTAGLEKIFV